MQVFCYAGEALAGFFSGNDTLKDDMEANNPGFVCHITKLKEFPPGKLYDPVTDTLSDDPAYTPAPPPEPSPEQIQAAIIEATQKRLDDFARTRNYGGILSACTYVSSSVPKFAAEGQCAVNARDTTWATLYEILADVQAGERPVPTGYAEVEPLLPALTWPE